MANKALIHLEDRLLNATNRSITLYGLPAPDRSLEQEPNHLISRELNYDPEMLRATIESSMENLTPEQRLVYETIMRSVQGDLGQFIFIDAPGNCNKQQKTT